MLAAMSELNFCPSSEVYISKTFDLNDMKFGRVVKKYHFLKHFRILDMWLLICITLFLMTPYEINEYSEFRSI